MSDTSIDMPQPHSVALNASGGTVGDYIALMKPRVMSLVLFTALTGIVAAPGSIHPVLAVAALICIGLGAGASGALNMWYDADIDARMARTASRPIPRGRVSAQETLTFGSVLAIGSVAFLGMLVNWAAAAMLALTIAFYVFVYTIWLKRRTPQNIVIGGAAGAFPPMVGWAAATGTIGMDSVLLFAIIFMWTPPHFWALALTRSHEYQRVDVPMLPVVAGTDETRRQILIYSLILMPLAIAPAFTGLGGPVYGVVAANLSIIFMFFALKVYKLREGAAADRAARILFSYSILYLFILFATILVEHAFGLAG